MKHLSACLLLSCALCLSSPFSHPVWATQQAQEEKQTRYVQSMDTLITLTGYGPHAKAALDAAEKEVLRLNDLLSTGLSLSEISQLNQKGSGILSEDTKAIVEKALALYEDTQGLFDITIYPLMQLWGFATSAGEASDDIMTQIMAEENQRYHVPTEQELELALSKIGSDRLTLSDTQEGTLLTLGEGQSIDLGGIAKGYTSARLMQIYQEEGLTSGMVSLGGNVQCLGRKPDGSDYVIAIRNPFGEDSYAATVKVHNMAVITSGGYERFFTDPGTGVTYQHIMDPNTGYPAQSDLASVSILSGDGMLGDGLSTSLYIMGKEKAISYWQSHQKEFEMILIGTDKNIYVTEGLKDSLLSPADYELVSAS